MRVTQPLSDGERLQFEQCRELIRNNLKTCFEVGAALIKIRDGELYREHWPNFEAFCRAEFNLGKSHAYRLMDAAKVNSESAANKEHNQSISPIGDAVLSESHARELKNVPVELRSEVLEAATAASGGQPTADSIREAAKAIVPHGTTAPPAPSQPVIELDATGFAIPEKLVEFWNRRSEVRELMTALSKVRVAMRKAQEEDDLLYRPVVGRSHQQNWTTLITSLDKAYASIDLAMPYAVCPMCQGLLREQCGTCQERGFVSEFFYKHAFASDARKVREAACQKKDK